MSALLVGTIALTVVFAVSNGMKDGLNVAATAIASKSTLARLAIIIVVVAEFFGPFLLGTEVARTVAQNIINVAVVQQSHAAVLMITCGVAGALLWNLLAWWVKMPTSSSFTLVGGLIGPVMFEFGSAAVPWRIFFIKVIVAMFLSPLLGMGIGYLVYQLLRQLLQHAPLAVNTTIKKLQCVTLVFLGANHGTNDSQKSMGIIALLLYLSGNSTEIAVPLWVKFICIAGIVTGIILGGTRIIRTVGYGIIRLRPHHSLESQLTAAGILVTCNLVGAPVSTTQIITSSVIGVGSGFRRKSVRWLIIRDIIWSWFLTIPLTALFSAGVYWVTITLLGLGGWQ